MIQNGKVIKKIYIGYLLLIIILPLQSVNLPINVESGLLQVSDSLHWVFVSSANYILYSIAFHEVKTFSLDEIQRFNASRTVPARMYWVFQERPNFAD